MKQLLDLSTRTSSMIAERSPSRTSELLTEHTVRQQGTLIRRLLCEALSAFSHRLPNGPIEVDALSAAPDEMLLRLSGHICQCIDEDATPPTGLFQAARHLTQLTRILTAKNILDSIKAGRTGPDPMTGTGDGQYCLYLRSFAGTHHLPKQELDPWGSVDLEEILTSKLSVCCLPLVAVGHLELSSYGAGKIHTTDDTWKDELVLLGKHSDFILVVPCVTNGTCWEIEWVVMQTFLRKAIFVMPASSGTEAEWWRDNWSGLRRWSECLGLRIPDYSPDGLVFVVTPNGGLVSTEYERMLEEKDIRRAFLQELFARQLQSEPSTDWIIASRNSLSPQGSLDLRKLTMEPHGDECAESHMARIEKRVEAVGPGLTRKVSPPLLGMLEKGRPPAGSFSDWPHHVHPAISSRPGVVTLWDGPLHLLWAEATPDVRSALSLHAAGNIELSAFCRSIYQDRVLPRLTPQQRNDRDYRDRATRLHIGRHVNYRVLPMAMDEARASVEVVLKGVLDAGPPAYGGG